MAAVTARKNARSGIGPLVWGILLVTAIVVAGLLLYLVKGGTIPVPFTDPPVQLSLGASDDDANRPQAPDGWIPVPVSAVTIPAYSKVTRDHFWDTRTARLTVVYLDPDTMPDDIIVDRGEIVGRVLANEKSTGYVFTKGDFMPKGTRPGLVAGIPPGKRALRVDASLVSGLVGLSPRDRFDVIATIPLDERAQNRLDELASEGNSPYAVELASKRLVKRASVRVIVQNGVVVSPLQTRGVPIASSSLTQGLVTRTRPVQEVVIALDPEEVAPLSEALAVEAHLVCVPRSGHPDDPIASETPGLDPTRAVAGEGSTLGSNLRFVEQIRGGSREYVSVPGEAKKDETEEPRGK